MGKGHPRDKLRQEIIQQFPGAKKKKGRLNIMTKTVVYLIVPGDESEQRRSRYGPFRDFSITGGENDLSKGKFFTTFGGQILCWPYDLHNKKCKILLVPVGS